MKLDLEVEDLGTAWYEYSPILVLFSLFLTLLIFPLLLYKNFSSVNMVENGKNDPCCCFCLEEYQYQQFFIIYLYCHEKSSQGTWHMWGSSEAWVAWLTGFALVLVHMFLVDYITYASVWYLAYFQWSWMMIFLC